MTSELKSLIEQIGAKSRQLHQSLVTERERVRSMTDEINRLNADISDFQNGLYLIKITIPQNEVRILKILKQ